MLKDWVKRHDNMDRDWLVNYLSSPTRLGDPIGNTYEDILNRWERRLLSTPNPKEIMQTLSAAWATKCYRDRDKHSSCNLMLKSASKKKLKELSSSFNISMGAVVDGLLLGEDSHQISKEVQTEKREKSRQIAKMKKENVEERRYSEALNEMLTAAIIEISRLKLSTPKESNKTSPSACVVAQAAELEVREIAVGLGQNFALMKRLRQGHTFDLEYIGNRLKTGKSSPLALRPHSIRRKLSLANLPSPRARLSEAERQLAPVQEILGGSWLSPGNILTISGRAEQDSNRIASAIAIHHCTNGARIRYTTAFDLFNKLEESENIHLEQKISHLNSIADLLIIGGWDNVGWTSRRLEIFLDLLTSRERFGSTIIISRLSIDAWLENIEDNKVMRKAFSSKLLDNSCKLTITPEPIASDTEALNTSTGKTSIASRFTRYSMIKNTGHISVPLTSRHCITHILSTKK